MQQKYNEYQEVWDTKIIEAKNPWSEIEKRDESIIDEEEEHNQLEILLLLAIAFLERFRHLEIRDLRRSIFE